MAKAKHKRVFRCTGLRIEVWWIESCDKLFSFESKLIIKELHVENLFAAIYEGKNNDAPLLDYWRTHEEWYLCEGLNLSGDTTLFWRKWCWNPLKIKLLEYSDRPANVSFIPARLHSKVCDVSLAWRTEYGHAHDNLFIHSHHSRFFWWVIKRIADWKDEIKLDDNSESRSVLTINPIPERAFEEVMNLRQLVSMKRRIGDGSHVFHWWLSFRAELGINICINIPWFKKRFKRTGRKDSVHVYQPLHSSMVFVFPNQWRWDLEERSP